MQNCYWRPPSCYRVQLVSRQHVGQSEQMKPWNCCRYRHSFSPQRTTGWEKCRRCRQRSVMMLTLEFSWNHHHSSLGPTSHGPYSFFFSKTHWVKCGWDSASGAKFMYICCSCVHHYMRALFEDVYLMLFSSHVFYYEWIYLISCQLNVD